MTGQVPRPSQNPAVGSGACQSTKVVLALVLTHNAPKALDTCLRAIAGQTRVPDLVVVVDNASAPPASPGLLFDRLIIHRESVNGGPAGGHASGLRLFLTSGATHAWVMDDDCVPAPDCLERLTASPAGLTFPTWVDGLTGRVVNWPAWCGFLIARSAVEIAGLPREDFVWWAEDTEYLQRRVPRAGVAVFRCVEAVVTHNQVRRHGSKPSWKFYYEARNSTYYRLHIQVHRPHVYLRLVRTLARLTGHALFVRGRRRALVMVVRGIGDGVVGRLGMRVPLGAREKPLEADGDQFSNDR